MLLLGVSLRELCAGGLLTITVFGVDRPESKSKDNLDACKI